MNRDGEQAPAVRRGGRRGLAMIYLPRYYMPIMTTTALKIAREMRQLPVQEMLTLHECLITTIHRRDGEQGFAPPYSAEIKRRVKEIKSGAAKRINARVALRRM